MRTLFFANPKLLTAVEIRSDLCAVNDVLAWQARNIGTGTADPFTLNYHGTLTFPGLSSRRDTCPLRRCRVPPDRILQELLRVLFHVGAGGGWYD